MVVGELVKEVCETKPRPRRWFLKFTMSKKPPMTISWYKFLTEGTSTFSLSLTRTSTSKKIVILLQNWVTFSWHTNFFTGCSHLFSPKNDQNPPCWLFTDTIIPILTTTDRDNISRLSYTKVSQVQLLQAVLKNWACWMKHYRIQWILHRFPKGWKLHEKLSWLQSWWALQSRWSVQH